MDIGKYNAYFDKMKVGDRVSVSKAKDPEKLIAAGKICIDLGCPIIFSNDYSEIIKLEYFEFPSVKNFFYKI